MEALRAISAPWAATKTVDDETVIDADLDQLTGSSGADWFIISSGDKVTDFKVQKKDGRVARPESSMGVAVGLVDSSTTPFAKPQGVRNVSS